MDTVGGIVRELRTELEWSQRQLATFLDVGNTQVSMIENDKSDMPAGKFLRLLDRAGWTITRRCFQ